MPEFILDHGSPEASKMFNALDNFTQGYITAIFFTDTGHRENEGLEDATVAELAPATLADIIADCAEFQASFGEYLDEACDNGRINGYDLERAGNDFWYTRNAHGVGFWCRELGDPGDKLDAAAKEYRELYTCRGDDGLIYIR